MKKGIRKSCLPKEVSIKEFLSIAAKRGFSGVELTFGEGEIGPETTESELKKICSLAKEYHLEIASLSTGRHKKEEFLVSASEKVQKRGRDFTRSLLQAAKTLGARVCLIVPARITPELDYAKVYERCLSGLKEMGRMAQEADVEIGIENGGMGFLLSPLEFRDFLKEVGTGRVGIYFDTANCMLDAGLPEQWIRLLGPFLKMVHIKDYIARSRIYTQIFQGDVNWQAVIQALRDVGYEGYLVAEIPPYKAQKLKIAEDISRNLDLLLNM